jgi:protein phosphatase
MPIEFGAITDLGRVRTNNEDTLSADPDNGIFVVADGMGGHKSGEVASKMAAELILNDLRRSLSSASSTDRRKLICSSIDLANQAVFEAGQKYPENKGMGTTVVVTLFGDKTCAIGWVGDSRIYIARHNQIRQLSRDHSLVQEQVKKGIITPEQAETSEFKNVLTRAIGTQEKVEADTDEIPVFEDDYIIMCSDGLTRMVSDEDILRTIEVFKDPEVISNELVELANSAGGKDNVTVIVVHKKKDSILGRFFKTISK